MRFYVLWRIIRAPRQGFRHIFLRTFCVPAMHCLHAKTGVLMHFLRVFCVLWYVGCTPRGGFRTFFARFCALAHCSCATAGVPAHFLRAFYVLWYIGCTPRGGFSTFFCALRQVLKFFCAFFVFVGGFARFGAILAKRRRREEANSEKTSPIRKQKAKKTKKEAKA